MKKRFLSAFLALVLFAGNLPAWAHAAGNDALPSKDFSQYLTGESLRKEELTLGGRPFYQVSLDEAIEELPTLDGTGKKTYEPNWPGRELTEYNAHLMGAIGNGSTWNYRIVAQQLTGSGTLFALEYFGGDPFTGNVASFETEIRGLATGDKMADVLEKLGLSAEGAALVADELINNKTNFDLNTGKTYGSSLNDDSNSNQPGHNMPIVRYTVDGVTLNLDFMGGKLANVWMYLILEEAPSAPAEPEAPSAPAPTVVLSPQKLAVDGKNADCEKYNIGGSNYFKLRDLAQLLNGTGSQFGVGFDAATSTVTIATGEAYTPTGTELAAGVDNSATAQPSGQSILIDGVAHDGLTAYNIGGSNFFQLRELGDILGFEVGYDADTNTAIVRSTQK